MYCTIYDFCHQAFRPGLQDPGKLRTTRNFGNDDDSSGEMTSVKNYCTFTFVINANMRFVVQYGQKQSYALGQFLRKRYGDIIPAQFTKDQVSCFVKTVAIVTVFLAI